MLFNPVGLRFSSEESQAMPGACNFAANPLCFIDVPGSVFRAVTITTAFELLAGAGNVSLVARLIGAPCNVGLARAVGDEG